MALKSGLAAGMRNWYLSMQQVQILKLVVMLLLQLADLIGMGSSSLHKGGVTTAGASEHSWRQLNAVQLANLWSMHAMH